MNTTGQRISTAFIDDFGIFDAAQNLAASCKNNLNFDVLITDDDVALNHRSILQAYL